MHIIFFFPVINIKSVQALVRVAQLYVCPTFCLLTYMVLSAFDGDEYQDSSVPSHEQKPST